MDRWDDALKHTVLEKAKTVLTTLSDTYKIINHLQVRDGDDHRDGRHGDHHGDLLKQSYQKKPCLFFDKMINYEYIHFDKFIVPKE